MNRWRAIAEAGQTVVPMRDGLGTLETA